MVLRIGDKVQILPGVHEFLTDRFGRMSFGGDRGTCEVIFQEKIPDVVKEHIRNIGQRNTYNDYSVNIPEEFVVLIHRCEALTFRTGDKVKVINKADTEYGKILELSGTKTIECGRIRVGTIKENTDRWYMQWEIELVEKKVFDKKNLIL